MELVKIIRNPIKVNSEICWSSIDFGIALTYDTLCISHACFVHHPALGVMVQVGSNQSAIWILVHVWQKHTRKCPFVYSIIWFIYIKYGRKSREINKFWFDGREHENTLFYLVRLTQNAQIAHLGIRLLSKVCWYIWDFTLDIIPSSWFYYWKRCMPQNLHPFPVFDRF